MSPRGCGGPPRPSGELGASCLGSTFPSAQASWIPPAPAAPPPHFPPPAPPGPRGPPDPTAPLGVPSTELPVSLGLSAVPPPEGGPGVPWGAWGLVWPPARLRRWEPRTPGESRAAGNQRVGRGIGTRGGSAGRPRGVSQHPACEVASPLAGRAARPGLPEAYWKPGPQSRRPRGVSEPAVALEPRAQWRGAGHPPLPAPQVTAALSFPSWPEA